MLKIANHVKDEKLTQGAEKMWAKLQVPCCGIVKLQFFLTHKKVFKIRAVALNSIDKHKYKNFDKYMIKEKSKTE